MRVRWTSLAIGDLSHAHDYVSEGSPAAAARLIGRIEVAVATLARHPHLGRAGRVEGTREFAVAGTPYVVIYCLEDRSLAVLAVVHGARKWPDPH